HLVMNTPDPVGESILADSGKATGSLAADREFRGFPDHVLRIFCREFLGEGEATETGGSRESVANANHRRR
ncbi:MAG: hypothetical protein WCF80_10545, partial [Pseudolabrys sp.]